MRWCEAGSGRCCERDQTGWDALPSPEIRPVWVCTQRTLGAWVLLTEMLWYWGERSNSSQTGARGREAGPASWARGSLQLLGTGKWLVLALLQPSWLWHSRAKVPACCAPPLSIPYLSSGVPPRLIQLCLGTPMSPLFRAARVALDLSSPSAHPSRGAELQDLLLSPPPRGGGCFQPPARVGSKPLGLQPGERSPL